MERIDGHLVRPDQPLALGLASTVHAFQGSVVDALGGPEDLAAWLRLHADRLGDAALEDVDPAEAFQPVRSLRDALRHLLAAAAAGDAPGAADVEAVNAASRAAPRHSELRWAPGGRPHAVGATAAPPVPALVGMLAADGIAVIGGEHGPVRACEAPSCVLYFVRNHPRQEWCSPSCGNRARVARHYRRATRPVAPPDAPGRR